MGKIYNKWQEGAKKHHLRWIISGFEGYFEAFITVTTKLLKAGDKITFPGFGAFGVSERTARKGRNPQTGAEIQIAASKSGKVTDSKDLKGL